jgi:hypothetical protein
MREIRLSGSEGGGAHAPYPYQHALRGTMNGDGKASGKGGFRGLKAP